MMMRGWGKEEWDVQNIEESLFLAILPYVEWSREKSSPWAEYKTPARHSRHSPCMGWWGLRLMQPKPLNWVSSHLCPIPAQKSDSNQSHSTLQLSVVNGPTRFLDQAFRPGGLKPLLKRLSRLHSLQPGRIWRRLHWKVGRIPRLFIRKPYG